MRIHGLSDLTVTKDEFAGLSLPVKRVFITENEINLLALPERAESMVLFGSGFDPLAPAGWLRDKEMFYWGDIDTHGFAILDQLRSSFPAARSLLMDRATLLAHWDFWGKEDRPATRGLERLQPEGKSLYDDLRHDRNRTGPGAGTDRVRPGWKRQSSGRSSSTFAQTMLSTHSRITQAG